MSTDPDKLETGVITLVVSKEGARIRLDRFLAEKLPQFSRSRIQQLIKDGTVAVNNHSTRPSSTLRVGDTIRIDERPIEKMEALPEDIPLEIIFEDNDLVLINKPAGLVMHPGAGHHEHTLVNALLHHCQNLSGIGGKERPGIVHRLDKDTSGCVVVAKNDETHRGLSDQFAARTVEKIYLAIVAGKLGKSAGLIEENIGRHPIHRQRMSVDPRRGRAAKTEFRVVRAGDAMSLVQCRLHSGRTHQIRVHLHHIGHPVLGDKVYGRKHAGEAKRQMLHSWKLGFTHPRTDEWKEFEAAIPNDFEELLSDAGLR